MVSQRRRQQRRAVRQQRLDFHREYGPRRRQNNTIPVQFQWLVGLTPRRGPTQTNTRSALPYSNNRTRTRRTLPGHANMQIRTAIYDPLRDNPPTISFAGAIPPRRVRRQMSILESLFQNSN